MNDNILHNPSSRFPGRRRAVTPRLFAAAATAALAVAAGAHVGQTAPFSSRAALGASQDLSVVAPPTWPAIDDTCTASCAITLHAGIGSVTVNDVANGGPQVVPIWGFNVNGAGGGEHTLAGGATSTIKVPLDTTLTITFTQDPLITDPIELSFPSLAIGDVTHPDSATYVVHATRVGTSVFQPGGNPAAPRQIAMGLVGVMIVTPADGTSVDCPTCAFDGGQPYDDEAVVALTDVDPEFAANPSTFDMSYFGLDSRPDATPRAVYHLLNGRSFPDSDVIDVRNGDSLLLRYVNASSVDKTMGMLGLRQRLLGRNASAYANPQTMVAPLIGPGETADVAVAVPPGDTAGQRYQLAEQGWQMNHGTAQGFGGALTFVNVWSELGSSAVTTVPTTTVPGP